MPYPVVLSHVQARPLLAARQAGHTQSEASPDLALSTVTVVLSEAGVTFPSGELVGWAEIERIARDEMHCFVIRDGVAEPIQVFSEATNRMCSLYPTQRAPTMLIAGFTMHRIVAIDPLEDTRRKIATIKPVTGRVLDTATGLGYTAIEAAQSADEVITIELDPGAQEIARQNPWSRDLFSHPRIKQIMGDAFEVVPTFASDSFARIIHDPPVFSLAGELYSGQFYRELYRVLQRGGRLFHYIGDLNSKSGSTVTRGVLRRLQEAGFTRITKHPQAFGVVASK